MRRRLAVVLMIDMVNYSSAMEKDQAGTIGLIRELREKWLEPEVAERGGEVLKRMGDGWIIAFPSVTDAIEAAQAVQIGLNDHNKIRLRIAAHLGEIAEDEADIYGAGINITARLQTEAPPGGVMISEDLYRQLDERLSDGFSDAGTYVLKNVAHPIVGYQWRPIAVAARPLDEVPVIAVEQVLAVPETSEALEIGADLREQLIHTLSRRTGIKVLSSGTSNKDEATYILKCRLRNRGTQARITSTLIRCSDGYVTWSRVFDGDPSDLFEMTDRAAEQLSDALRLQINAFDGDRLADVPDDQLSSSELRTRAAMLFYRATVADYRYAKDLVVRALRLDPGNASGLAMWSEANLYINEACHQTAEPEFKKSVLASADKAVQAAPRSDYCWFVRAHVRSRLAGDIEGARKDIERLAQLNPSYVLGMEARGYTEFFAGNWDLACEALADAAARSDDDPFLPFRLYPLAVAHMLAGRPDPALTAITEAIELRRTCRQYWLVKAWILRESGRVAEATEAREAAELLPLRAEVLAQNLHLHPDVRDAIGLPNGEIEAE